MKAMGYLRLANKILMASIFLSLSAHVHHEAETSLSLFMLWMNSQIRSSDCSLFGSDTVGIFRAPIRRAQNGGENVCWLAHE